MRTTIEVGLRTRTELGQKLRRISGYNACKRALAITAVALLVGACSDNSSKDKPEESSTGIAASKVCDGTLDTSAAAALQRLAGTDQFDESTGTNEAGVPTAFSLRNAIKNLHDEYRKRSACWVYKTGDDSGEPLLEVRFSASRSYPSESENESSGGKVRYSLGVYTRVGPNGADLFFQCTTKAPTEDAYVGDTKYVKAELFSVADKMRGDNVNKDRIVILNSISRRLTQEAGCASEADLPAEVPSQ